jgi:hypothetical protein
MAKHNVAKLETRIKDLAAQMAQLADDSDLKELIKIIHRPGWTSVAEFALVRGVVDAMIVHTKALAGLKRALLTGSRAVRKEE